MTDRLKFCLKAAKDLGDQDLAALTDAIEAYVRAGAETAQAEQMAVDDLLASLEADRTETVGLLKAQHPQQFTVDRPALPSKAAAKPEVKPSGNKIFTDDAAAAARALLKRKLGGGTLNSGIDPEVVQAGLTLAGYHIEKGARTFAAFTKAMLEDMGEIVKPYLKSWYAAAYYHPGLADVQKDMTSLADLDKPAAAIVPAGLTVTFGGKTYPVDSLQDAQRKWIAFQESSGGGVSQVGNGVVVLDGAGRTVGRVSYNGRLWDANDKLLAEAPAPGVPPPAAAQPELVEHVTKGGKGKTIKGVVRADLTKEQAQAIDEYTFKKGDGWFIREKHLDALAARDAQTAAAPAPEAPQTTEVPKSLTQHLYEAIKADGMPKDNPALTKMVETLAPGTSTKVAQEALEAAIVMQARDIVDRKQSTASTFD